MTNVVASSSPSSNSRPRIIVLFGNIPLLGQERSNIDALESLRDSGCEVLFVIRPDRTKDTIQAELNRRGLPWVAVPYYYAIRRGYGVRVWLKNIEGILSGSWQLLRQAHVFRPTHIHAANPEHVLNFLPALLWMKTPMVYRAGDAPTLHHWLWRLVSRFIVYRTTRFASISRYVDGLLIALGVSPDKIIRVSTQASTMLKRQRVEEAAVPCRCDQKFTFVYVGQITRQKGVDLLVDAAIAYCAVSPGCRFLLAGEFSWNNPLADGLRRRIEEAGLSDRIVFLGYVNDIGALLDSADVHVCPSVVSEALGNVVIEAKLNGKPSIIFPTGGLAELVLHRVDGFVCQEASSSALQHAFSVYEACPRAACEQGNAARQSLGRLQGDLSFAEQWNAVYGNSQV